jgi:hypothetical protein
VDERLIALGLAQPAPASPPVQAAPPAPEPVLVAPPDEVLRQIDARRGMGLGPPAPEPGLAELFPEMVRAARPKAPAPELGRVLDEPVPTAAPVRAVVQPTAMTPPESVADALPNAAVRQAVRIRDGRRDRDGLCELDGAGIRITGLLAPLFIPWADARAISVNRGYVTVVLPAGSIDLGVALDGVAEPALATLFADVLEAGRGGALEPNTGTLHELGLGIDRTVEGFADADDPVVPLAVAAVVGFVGLVLLPSLPTILQLMAHLEPAPGAFALMPRIAFFDPRVVVAAFALSAGLASAVVQLALGPAALSWARGTLRGWHRGSPGLAANARRAIAHLMLGSRIAALVAGVALVTLLPSAYARAVIDADGIHEASGFPLISRDRLWSEVTDVAPLAVGFSERAEGFDTMLVFSGGDRLSTRGRDLAGGTVRVIYDFERAHLR